MNNQQYIKEIIKVGIQGGAFGDFSKIKDFNWFIGTGDDADFIFFDNGSTGIKVSLHKNLLRSEFWQAIGKVKGWGIIDLDYYEIHQDKPAFFWKGEWQYFWHIFIDKIIEKDLDHAIEWLYKLIKE